MPTASLTETVLSPELELTKYYRYSLSISLSAKKKDCFGMEVCPKCATPSVTGYDRRKVRVKDAPLRNRAVTLVLTKRRFFCKKCKKPCDDFFVRSVRNLSRSRFQGFERGEEQRSDTVMKFFGLVRITRI